MKIVESLLKFNIVFLIVVAVICFYGVATQKNVENKEVRVLDITDSAYITYLAYSDTEITCYMKIPRGQSTNKEINRLIDSTKGMKK